MKILEIMAIMIPPIYGMWVINMKFKLNIKDNIYYYVLFLVLSNWALILIISLIRGYESIVFTISFFLKYVLINSILTFLLAMIVIVLKENFQISLKIKKVERKK